MLPQEHHFAQGHDTVALGHLAGLGLDLVPAVSKPNDKPDLPIALLPSVIGGPRWAFIAGGTVWPRKVRHSLSAVVKVRSGMSRELERSDPALPRRRSCRRFR
jgi:hypothetical protein